MSDLVTTENQLTKEEFKKVLPPSLKRSVSDTLLDQINTIIATPNSIESFKDSLLSYTGVLSKGRFKVSDYVNAVKYVSFKLMDMTNRDAYYRTFPERLKEWDDDEVSIKIRDSYVSQYNKGKLVNLIWAETMIPVHILNHSVFQQTINNLVDISTNGKSEMARVQAMGHILNYTKPPETKKIELDLGASDSLSSTIDQLREATRDLANAQLKQLKEGTISIEQIAEAEIIEKDEDDN